MHIRRSLLALIAVLTVPVTATGHMAAAQAISPGGAVQSANPAPDIIAYGSHPLQQLDFYRPADDFAGPRPLIVFVHGGAWAGGDKSDSTGAAKIRHYTGQGYALASINYRLLPEVEIEDQAADLAAAIAAMVGNAAALNVDPGRIVLMGHSAGAHLAALAATDPQWLGAHDMAPADLAGAVLLDGAAYDVPRQIVDAGPLLGIVYQVAFGSGMARQERLSPAHHSDGRDARRFLIVHIERRDAAVQARSLAEALRNDGTDAEIVQFPGRGLEGHNRLNAMLGRSDSPATSVVDEWLRMTFAKSG